MHRKALYSRGTTNARVPRLQYNKRAKELLVLLLYNSCDSLGKRLTRLARKANQYHTCRVDMARKDELAKILLCQQDALFTMRLLYEYEVIRALHDFAHRINVIARGTQGSHDGKVATFASEKA